MGAGQTGLRYIAKTPEILLVAASFQMGDEGSGTSFNRTASALKAAVLAVVRSHG
jgi:hypothetical protein